MNPGGRCGARPDIDEEASVIEKALKRNGELLGVDMKRLPDMAYASRAYVVDKSGFKLPAI